MSVTVDGLDVRRERLRAALDGARPVVPDRSLEQRVAALRRANAVRCRKAAIKADIRSGAVDPRELLLARPSSLRDMRLGEILRAVPRTGPTMTARALSRLGVTDSKPVGQLTERQVTMLLALLPPHRGVSR